MFFLVALVTVTAVAIVVRAVAIVINGPSISEP
jgi:hypothetical protein